MQTKRIEEALKSWITEDTVKTEYKSAMLCSIYEGRRNVTKSSMICHCIVRRRQLVLNKHVSLTHLIGDLVRRHTIQSWQHTWTQEGHSLLISACVFASETSALSMITQSRYGKKAAKNNWENYVFIIMLCAVMRWT